MLELEQRAPNDLQTSQGSHPEAVTFQRPEPTARVVDHDGHLLAERQHVLQRPVSRLPVRRLQLGEEHDGRRQSAKADQSGRLAHVLKSPDWTLHRADRFSAKLTLQRLGCLCEALSRDWLLPGHELPVRADPARRRLQ